MPSTNPQTPELIYRSIVSPRRAQASLSPLAESVERRRSAEEAFRPETQTRGAEQERRASYPATLRPGAFHIEGGDEEHIVFPSFTKAHLDASHRLCRHSSEELNAVSPRPQAFVRRSSHVEEEEKEEMKIPEVEERSTSSTEPPSREIAIAAPSENVGEAKSSFWLSEMCTLEVFCCFLLLDLVVFLAVLFLLLAIYTKQGA